jgi:hypothetical protein
MDRKKQKRVHDWREARRLRAWELKQEGWKQKDIAYDNGGSCCTVGFNDETDFFPACLGNGENG